MTLPIWAETKMIKLRSFLRFLIALAGVGLVLLGVYNMFVTQLIDAPVIAPYRQWGVIAVDRTSGYYLGDVLIIAVGAVIAWFS